jgi:hypothetical protein
MCEEVLLIQEFFWGDREKPRKTESWSLAENNVGSPIITIETENK